MKAVRNGLRHQWMVGHLALANEILGAGDLVREDRADKILGHHAHELRWHLLSAAEAGQCKRDAGYPAPTRAEHRCIEQRLDEKLAHGLGAEIPRYIGEVEAVRGGERQDDVILRCRRLELEIELAAEAFAQSEPPGAVDAAAIGRMDHELHAARLVEEALKNESLERRQRAKRTIGGAEVVDDLLGRCAVDPEIVHSPVKRTRGAAAVEAVLDLRAKARDRLRELVGTSRRLAKPEWNSRRLAVRVLDAHHASLNADDLISGVAELEDVALEALDGEVFVHRADHHVLRLEQNLKIGIVGDSSAGGDGGEPRSAPPAQHAVDLVAVDQGAAPSAPRGEALGQHAQRRSISFAVEVAVGPGAADECE